MKKITTVSEFYSLLKEAEETSDSKTFYFFSPWQDNNCAALLEQLNSSPTNDQIYEVNLFDLPELSNRFKINRSPSLVTYWGDSRQYRTYDIPHLIRRSFVSPKIKNSTCK
jgi:hypothetical protein